MTKIGVFRKLVAKTAGESELSQWMGEHYASIEETLASSGRRRWSAVAKFAGENGLTDGLGRVPTPVVAKQTWHRVKVRVARIRALRDALATQAPPVSLLPITVHVSPPPRVFPVSVAQPLPDPPSAPTARVRRPLVVEAEDDASLPVPNLLKLIT